MSNLCNSCWIIDGQCLLNPNMLNLWNRNSIPMYKPNKYIHIYLCISAYIHSSIIYINSKLKTIKIAINSRKNEHTLIWMHFKTVMKHGIKTCLFGVKISKFMYMKDLQEVHVNAYCDKTMCGFQVFAWKKPLSFHSSFPHSYIHLV